MDRSARRAQIAQMARDRHLSEPAILASLDQHMDAVGVFCLAARCEDILMWSHYADSHAGVCLVFDRRAPSAAISASLPITYQDERPVANPYLLRGQPGMRTLFLTKSDHWSYEREWRWIDFRLGLGAHRFASLGLAGVIFGARISDKNRGLLVDAIAASRLDIHTAQAHLDPTRYAVVCQQTAAT